MKPVSRQFTTDLHRY